MPAGRRWAAALGAIQAAVERRLEPPAGPAANTVHIDTIESATLVGGAASNGRRCEVFAHSASEGVNCATIIIAALGEGGKSVFEPLMAIFCSHALHIIAADERAISRDFWRRRALESGERLARAQAELKHGLNERQRLESAVAAALKLRPRNRFAGLGSIFARLGQFDGWIVAVAEGDELETVAANAVAAPIPALDQDSALAASFRRKTTIQRSITSAQPVTFHEDRLLANFAAYICVPFDGGAIALAARRPIGAAAVDGVEAFAARLGPLVRSWLIEAEAQRLRQLVKALGLRMFGAVDSERARIARDLHDHQAQLLAAGRIALEAGPDEARGIFKQLEEGLRLRVRELRPATLGRSSLEEALRYELRRLAEAGIKGRLLRANRMNVLTRPVQQLCYQVAREALSNVLRHSGATRVEIEVEKNRGHVRMTVLDNGKGIAREGSGAGIGLSGVRERLELMGGKLKIESGTGTMRLIADIPEPG